MKQLFKQLFMLLALVLLFGNTASAEVKRWVPIMIDDIMVMVPYGQSYLETSKYSYVPTEEIKVTASGALSGDRDWVSIFKKGDESTRNNIIAWNWVSKGKETILSNRYIETLPVGEYEARLFFHNSYNMESSDSFVVRKDTSIVLTSGQSQTNIADKGTYVHYKIYVHAGDVVNVDVYDMDANGNLYIKMGSPASVSNYDKKSENGGQTHSTQSESSTITANSDGFIYVAVYAPTYGCYTNVLHTVRITIGDNREFGTKGPYLDKVKSVKTKGADNKVVDAIYYLEGEANLPTIIYMSGWNSDLESYDGFLKYIASLGYCVVAKQERAKCFTPNVYEEELSERLTFVHNTYNADISKLGLIGHSSGGGTVHYLMNYFKSNNIAGNTKSVVISIDGWFPFGTTRAMLNGFDAATLLIQFGGLDAINHDGIHPSWSDYVGQSYHHYQDPKINLAIFKLLTQVNVAKEYIVLEANNNHSYIAGSYNTIMGRQDVLAPIDEFLNHTLGDGAAMNLIDQSNDVITNDVISEYRYYCHIGGYNFCDLNDLKFE